MSESTGLLMDGDDGMDPSLLAVLREMDRQLWRDAGLSPDYAAGWRAGLLAAAVAVRRQQAALSAQVPDAWLPCTTCDLVGRPECPEHGDLPELACERDEAVA